MVATSVPDPAAQELWKKNWAGQLSVSFAKFVPVFYNAINEALRPLPSPFPSSPLSLPPPPFPVFYNATRKARPLLTSFT